MRKGAKIYSIIYNLCPRCHSSRFWKYNNPYKNIITPNHDDLGRCKKCNLKFEIEPGFFLEQCMLVMLRLFLLAC